MIEECFELPALGAEMLFFRHEAQSPGILFLTDIWGIRPANIAMARRLANKGFAVLMPNLFHRWSRIRANGLEPEDSALMQTRLGELFASLTPAQMDTDGAAYLDFLLAQPSVRSGPAGVIGYCYTGQMAMHVAAARSDQVAAAVSFHGGWLATNKPESPHLLLPQIKARLYFGHADQDSMMPQDWIDRLEAALRDWHGAFQSEIYPGAQHGWTVAGRDAYNELAAERAFEKEVELFDATLKDS